MGLYLSKDGVSKIWTKAKSTFQAKGNYVTTDTAQTISGVKTYSSNQVFTGYLDIRGTAAEKHLKTRGIGGSDGNGNESDLYLQYSSNYSTKFGKSGNGSLNSDGTITEAGTLLSNKYAAKNDLANYLPLSGGTLTGNLSGKYITGTWLQTTAASDLGSAPPKYGVIDSGGWLYTRTLAETKSDLGVPTKVSELTNDSGYLNDVAITSSSSGSTLVRGTTGSNADDPGSGPRYPATGTINIGLGATDITITPLAATDARGSYNPSTGDYSWTLYANTAKAKVTGTIKWSGGDDQLKITKNGSENVVGYFNKINGQSIVALDSPKDFSLLPTSSFDDFINNPFGWVDDAGSYDVWTYFIRDELGFIDTPHPTYYLHTMRALTVGSNNNYIVFSVISTQSTAYSKASLYSDFPNKNIHASGYYNYATKANYRVNAVTPKSTTTILIDYGSNEYITLEYGLTYFTDDVIKIA